jgi:predicted protein tyrosine phosphatase
MPWIQNIALVDVARGHHIRVGENSMMIQIVDPDMEFPKPLHQFKEVHQFQFLDIEEDGLTNNGDGTWTDMSEFAVTDKQANKLVQLLQHALANRMDVVVHCHAGVCRSGAVAEVGVMMGFDDSEAFRSPNLLVKHKMMKKLGWTYNEDEPHSINGVALPEDWTNNNEKVFTLAKGRKAHREREGEN